MKSASIFFRKNDIIIHALSKTQAGFWIASEPYIKLMGAAGHAEIIASILKALNDSKQGVSNPTNWSESKKMFLDILGLKSSRELEKPDIKYCSVEMEHDTIIFTPSIHAKPPDKGFLHKPQEDSEKIAHTASYEKIAEALQRALSKCE